MRNVINRYEITNLQFDKLVNSYNEFHYTEKEMRRKKKEVLMEVKRCIPDKTVIPFNGGYISVTEVTANVVDIQRLQEEQPEICANYLRTIKYEKVNIVYPQVIEAKTNAITELHVICLE